VAGSSGSNPMPQVGKLQLQLFNSRNTGQCAPIAAPGGLPSTEATRAPEGKKWFTLPGLKTGAGETFQGRAFSKDQYARVRMRARGCMYTEVVRTATPLVIASLQWFVEAASTMQHQPGQWVAVMPCRVCTSPIKHDLVIMLTAMHLAQDTR
jgi:hypothetical protein